MMSGGTAYFNQITGVSVWYALMYVVRGWSVVYFDETRVGKVLRRTLAHLSRGRFSPTVVEYQLGNYRGLYAEIVRVALATTDDWFRAAEDALARRWFAYAGQEHRVEAYVKKAVLLRVWKLALRLMIVEKLSRECSEEAVFVADGSQTTRRWLRDICVRTGTSVRVSTSLSLPARVDAVATLARYCVATLMFVLRRGVSIHEAQGKFLVANPAKWPMRGRRGGDFLVDGKSIFPSDVLLYYDSRNVHPVKARSVDSALGSGYTVVAWDRARIRLGRLFSWEAIARYVVGPVLHILRSLLPGGGDTRCELAKVMLRLRRHTMGWDVFFERYAVGALVDGSYAEDQAAAAMSIHSHGGISVGLQLSEYTDPFNELNCFFAHHTIFTWGQGVADLWKDLWYADEVIPAGYIWGHLHRQSMTEREAIRAKFGVLGDAPLVAAFDTSVGRDSFNTPSALQRFYEAITLLADTLNDATVLIKPKSVYLPADELKLRHKGASGSRIIRADPLYNDTNEVIAASDLVVNMGHSSTVVVEALIGGVPTLVLDETGRDWHGTLGRPEGLVYDNAEELCMAASEILQNGIDSVAWTEIQGCIRSNFGESDGRAIERVRARILAGRQAKDTTQARGVG